MVSSIDFDNPGDKVITPNRLAHVVLRSANLKQQRDFYLNFLGAHVTFENEHMVFLTYDHEHHRVAIITVPDTKPKIQTTNGLEHIAFTFETLSDLMIAYRQRLSHGIKPYWCVNHGPTTSMYYKDFDGNNVETQVENMTTQGAIDFMLGPEFKENSIGVDFDPEELIEKIKKGESEESLKIRPNIGPRDLPTDK